MKIGCATVNQIPLDWQNNTQNILDAIAEAKRQKIELLCLPELCITGYGCEDMFLSEWVPVRAWEELLKIREHCKGIAVSVGLPVRIDDIVDLDREAVVQDLNSQRVGELLSGYPANPGGRIRVWDCCAASGGKSIMAKDILRNIDLTVSDVRESILVNLQ